MFFEILYYFRQHTAVLSFKRLLNYGCLTYSAVANNSWACFEVLFLESSSNFITALPIEFYVHVLSRGQITRQL
jgi:hypothetical protein